MQNIYYKEYNKILDKMTECLKKAETNCSISYNILSQMIVLSKSAIKFAENILNNTTNDSIAEIAGIIIENENVNLMRIADIKDLCCDLKNYKTDIDDYSCNNCKIQNNMINNMKSTNGNFLNSVFNLYSGIVELLRNALNYKTCEKFKAFAYDAISNAENILYKINNIIE